jgi:hypothetical protein
MPAISPRNLYKISYATLANGGGRPATLPV